MAPPWALHEQPLLVQCLQVAPDRGPGNAEPSRELNHIYAPVLGDVIHDRTEPLRSHAQHRNLVHIPAQFRSVPRLASNALTGK